MAGLAQERMDVKPLLLPHFPDLVLGFRGGKFFVEKIPSWLNDLIGTELGSLLGKPVNETLEKIIPGILELVSNVFHAQTPINGYSTTLFDRFGVSHNVSLEAQLIQTESGQLAVSVKILDRSLARFEVLPPPMETAFHGVVGQSAGMQRVFNKIRMYGVVDAPVLIMGETGTGKDVVASAIHQVSKRVSRQFIAVNCSAITETLFEAELFGHEKGSFTGAIRVHKGRFERADQGTLFLDEIGDLPLASQTKLLRVLEDNTIERVGGEKPIQVNVRVVAATNRNLEEAVQKREFRSDLFYRINALQIFLPALRERVDDLPLLVSHFIKQLNEKYRRQIVSLTPEALHLLKQYHWPGNIRELRNLLERLFAENETDVIGIRSLKEWAEERIYSAGNRPYNPNVTLLPYRQPIQLFSSRGDQSRADKKTTEDEHNKDEEARIIETEKYSEQRKATRRVEKLSEEEIKQAFKKADGNLTRAAFILGVHRATLYRRLKILSLNRSDLT
ncbi:sigma-54-dependent Fis family transcriptional regulator [bacterium]|nr:sigma-54-dependent Fis family transcriptional regulator [bacterium]